MTILEMALTVTLLNIILISLYVVAIKTSNTTQILKNIVST